MTVNELITKYGFTPMAVPQPDRQVSGGYIGDLLSWVMGKAQADNVWITIMTNINTVAVASLTDVALILLAEGVQADEDLIAAANSRGMNIAVTDKSAFEAACAIASDV